MEVAVATYSDLLSRLRANILDESSTARYTSAVALDFLGEAAQEINAELQLVWGVSAVAVSSAAVTVPASLKGLGSVTLDGRGLRRAMREEYEFYHATQIGSPRVYWYDPRVTPAILIAPSPSASATATLTFWKTEPQSVSGGDTPWGGLFPDFHDLVMYRAGLKAYQMGGEEPEKAKGIQWNHDLLYTRLAKHVGVTSEPQATGGQNAAGG